MPESPATRIATALAAQGVDRIFGVPGGGPNLDLIDAAAELGIRFVLAHAETSAAIMASTYGLTSGRPSAVVVTRGPGAASVVNGAAQATLDRFPLVVITDTVASADADRVAHQRIDQRAMLAPVTKAGLTVSSATEVDRIIDAIVLADSSPRGAVHLDVDASAPSSTLALGEVPRPSVAVRIDDRAEAERLLASSVRPIVIVGMGAVHVADRLRPVLERFGAPVLTTYQAVGIVPTEGALHAGLFTNGAVESEVLNAADLVIAIGLDMVEPIPSPWTLDAPVISLAPNPTTDHYLPIAVELIGDPAMSAGSLLDRASGWSADAAATFREVGRAALRPPSVGTLGPVDVVDTAARLAPADVTATVDAGAHFLAIMPFWPVAEPLRLLISNGLATMGFAVPAAIGAALARPGAPVIAFTGDGGMAMTLGELETIARLALPITIVVFNDAALTLIELKQRPGASGSGDGAVRFRPTDIAAQATAAGLDGVVVRSVAELEQTLAARWDTPRLVDARIDPSTYRHLLEGDPRRVRVLDTPANTPTRGCECP